MFARDVERQIERRAPMERTRSGGGAQAQPVLGDGSEVDEARMDQPPDDLDEEVVNGLLILRPKIAQGVLVDGHAPAQPDRGAMFGAEPIQLPRKDDAIAQGEHPQDEQHLRIGRWMALMTDHRLDRGVQLGQVQCLDGRPHQTCWMVRGNQRRRPDRRGRMGLVEQVWSSSLQYRGRGRSSTMNPSHTQRATTNWM